MNNYKLTIGWLYPTLMSTYGDRGNIIVLTKRCQWRGIAVDILPIEPEIDNHRLKNIDLIFGGGAQDREQEIVMKDLHAETGVIIKELIEKNVPALFVCGSPQLMGKYYEPAIGQRLEGLGIFDMVSKHPGKAQPRLIGNIVADVSDFFRTKNVTWKESISPVTRTRFLEQTPEKQLIVGFENHGGRTYLGKTAKPFAHVIKGNGNNGEDGTEGVVYKNAIGCYFHGPLLPKNPFIADWLIRTALEVKYHTDISLEPLDDTLEYTAQQAIAKKLGVEL